MSTFYRELWFLSFGKAVLTTVSYSQGRIFPRITWKQIVSSVCLFRGKDGVAAWHQNLLPPLPYMWTFASGITCHQNSFLQFFPEVGSNIVTHFGVIVLRVSGPCLYNLMQNHIHFLQLFEIAMSVL
jgi:hypothetical protein